MRRQDTARPANADPAARTAIPLGGHPAHPMAQKGPGVLLPGPGPTHSVGEGNLEELMDHLNRSDAS